MKTVQRPAHDPTIPDALSPSTQLLAELSGQGVLETLGAALRLSRRGGYTGMPLAGFALAFLSAGVRQGIRPFWETYKRALKRVAAVAGCPAFPSSASMSRALGKIDTKRAEAFADVALSLATTPTLSQVLSHPSVVHRNSRGEPLHVLDIDPSVQAFRLRDLVEGDDYPEPERESPGVPGYTGQYRGEVRVRHVAVCAAGAGVWLAYRVSEDNPHLATLFTSVLRPALAVMTAARVPLGQVLVRGDAEFGSAGVAKAIVELGVQLLVRLSRYRLLDRPEVVETLRTAEWEPVVSGGVRVREATDVGSVLLHPSAKSADAGMPGISLRVVAARRKVETEEVPYGVLRNGYQHELFGTTLPPDRWSPADIVALYAGRSSIENRFAQEDRELDLGRTFSYHAPGQAVFTALGLFLWNHWTCSGFSASPPPVDLPTPQPRDPVERRARSVPSEPAAGPHDDEVPVLAVERTEQPVADPPPAEPALDVSLPLDPMDPFPGVREDERAAVTAILKSAYSDQLRVPGWSLDARAFLRCPNDKRLFPFCVSTIGPRRTKSQVIIRTDVGACDGCPNRAECFSSTRPNMYKQTSRNISGEEAVVLTSFLDLHAAARRLPRKRPPCRDAPLEPSPPPPGPMVLPLAEATIGPWKCTNPTFQAAAARQRARSLHANVRVEVWISRRRIVSRDPDPRRTRQTWSQRDARWRLDASVLMVRHIPCQPPKNRGDCEV